MNNYSRLIAHFKNRRPLLNIILDGYGLGRQDHTDGIFLSAKPNIDKLFHRFKPTQLLTHGRHVGLPGVNDMGGSEVGHLTIGAGKVIQQGASLIHNMLADGSFFQQPVIKQLYATAKDSALHLIGLLSDGNIHSHMDHFTAIIKQAAASGVKRCYLHVLLDGRDTAVQSALLYVEQIEKLLATISQQNKDYDYRIVSGGGRETITMDRAKNWDKVRLGWQTHVEGESGNNFQSTLAAVTHFRSASPQIIDQDLPPFNVLDKFGKTTKIHSGEGVLFVNFRGDRAVELSRAFEEEGFSEFEIIRRPKVYYAGMTVYDHDTNLPRNVVVSGVKVENPFGKRILELGLQQFRLAETQKYPHVTFFFNGGYRLPLDPKREEYVLIESDRVASFAEKPAMKAAEIADKAVELLASGRFDYGLINFANPDMVGHSGDIEAVKLAVAAVDKALAKILAEVAKIRGLAVVTADHGNADEMKIFNEKTKHYEPSTKHSLNKVPFAIFDPLYQAGDYKLLFPQKETAEKTAALTLANIAATNFILLGQKIPDDIASSLFDI